MSLRVADTLEVRRWILGYGSEAEVLEPAALREVLRRDTEALAAKLAPQRKLARAISMALRQAGRSGAANRGHNVRGGK
jgi:hypothetical protein